MWKKLAIKAVIFLFKHANLSLADRVLLTTIVLDKLEALPLRDIILINEKGQLIVNGRSLDVNIARKLKLSAKAIRDSYAFKFIQEQVLYEATKLGVHQAHTPDQMIFSKAAIWWGQQEHGFLKLLAQDEDKELTLE